MQKGALQAGQLSHLRPKLNPKNSEAVHYWNQLGGLDWTGLVFLLQLQPVADVRGLVRRLCLIRDHFRRS